MDDKLIGDDFTIKQANSPDPIENEKVKGEKNYQERRVCRELIIDRNNY